MKLNHGRNRGLMISKRALPPGKFRKKEQISPGEAKSCVSFLAFLTPDSSIQPKLPQVVLSNKKTITMGMLPHLVAGKPGNFHIWREDSSWNNHKMFRKLLSLLMQCLEEYLATHQVILVVDVAKCHFHSTIFAYANKLGLRLLYIPAKLTWLLQPADTHCFSRLKAKLRRRWLELIVESETGRVSTTQWLLAFFEVAKTVLCGTKWLPAFKAVGLVDQNILSARILGHLGLQSPPVLPDTALTVDQLKSIFPRRCRVPLLNRTSLFKWMLAEAAPKAKPKAKASLLPAADSCATGSSAASPVVSPEGPISSRTRKRCKTAP